MGSFIPWDYVHVEVEDSLSGATATIHSKVVARRLMLCIQAGFEFAGDLEQGCCLFICEFKVVLKMPF